MASTADLIVIAVLLLGPTFVRQTVKAVPTKMTARRKVEEKAFAVQDSFGTEWAQDHADWEYKRGIDGRITKRLTFIS